MLRYLKPAIFLGCLAPLANLVWAGLHSQLGANPIEKITHSTGDCTLTFLLITLAVTPVRKLTRQYWLIGFRRMFGLFAFFYGFVHLATYIWLDQYFDFKAILKDMFLQRPFIITGFISFLMMVPLAITSTRKWIGRLGGSRWQMLHRLIYFSAAIGILHYYLRGKVEIGRAATYAGLLLILLGFRAWHALQQRRAQSTPQLKAV